MQSELPLLGYRHVGCRGSEAFAKSVRIIAFHGHADPGELHPDPSLVVVVGGWFLVELEFLLDCSGVEVLEIWQLVHFLLFLLLLSLDAFDLGDQVCRLGFLFL